MRVKVELEFDIYEPIPKYMLGYYLERNETLVINKIFEDYNDDDTPKNLGFIPDKIMSYRITKLEEVL